MEKQLTLEEFCTAAAACKVVEVGVSFGSRGDQDVFNIGGFAALAHNLVQLSLSNEGYEDDIMEALRLTGFSSLTSLSHLTRLWLEGVDLTEQEPWTVLSALGSLKELFLLGEVSGDPSSLTALTGLSSLSLHSHDLLEGVLPSTLSSLQPLSALQQLEELELVGYSCSATSLEGLGGLSRLTKLLLDADQLKSLEGVNTGLEVLFLQSAPTLASLAGIEPCTGLKILEVSESGVSCLQPLAGMSNLFCLTVGGPFTSLEGLEGDLCQSLQRLTLVGCTGLSQLHGIQGLHMRSGSIQGLRMLPGYQWAQEWEVTLGLQGLHKLSGIEELRYFACSDDVDDGLFDDPEELG